MKKSIWCNADIYGQLAVWILSVLPFIFFIQEAFKKNDFYMLLLVHGLGLLIIGIWQMVSTLVNLLFAVEQNKMFFRRNLWVGLILGAVFFVWAYTDNTEFVLPPAKYPQAYLMAVYFLIIDITAFRYWRHINLYYKQINHG
jgi:hypothetical protein